MSVNKKSIIITISLVVVICIIVIPLGIHHDLAVWQIVTDVLLFIAPIVIMSWGCYDVLFKPYPIDKFTLKLWVVYIVSVFFLMYGSICIVSLYKYSYWFYALGAIMLLSYGIIQRWVRGQVPDPPLPT